MKIIVGLGNAKIGYGNTRHNIGFKVIDLMRKRYPPSKIIKTQYYRGWETNIASSPVILIKPKLYMNENGIAVKKAWERFDGQLENYIIIHDELDVPLGKIKITRGKGPGGHRGVLSVINELGSNEFVRIRIGIGSEHITVPYIDYVLSPFLPEEKQMISQALERAVLSIEEIIRSGIEKAMSLYNI
ncbi:MAG: aminoacyl-tRNA hydrolase [Candidatus Ratteibacteria bacterium]|nr:aminoacyl-tRNA hydrolase [Candidatus Ratteibacteria bacterium]